MEDGGSALDDGDLKRVFNALKQPLRQQNSKNSKNNFDYFDDTTTYLELRGSFIIKDQSNSSCSCAVGMMAV